MLRPRVRGGPFDSMTNRGVDFYCAIYVWNLMATWLSEAIQEISSGKMSLELALYLLLDEVPRQRLGDDEVFDGVTYLGLGDDEIERALRLAEDTIMSQENPIEFVFRNCDIGENGYENRIMGIATELVSENPEVINAIKRAYRSIDNQDQQFQIQYVIERAGESGLKILSELEVDMELFYEWDAEGAAIYSGGIGQGPGEIYEGGKEEWKKLYKQGKMEWFFGKKE